MKSVNEVTKLSGVSRRTLRYYDEIGLLYPSAVKESGYRQYDDESLRRLWHILFYKELGLSLDDIRSLLDSPKELEKVLLKQHKQILLEKQSQLQKMTLSIDRILNDEFDISMLRAFDKNKIEEAKKNYAKQTCEQMESEDALHNFFRPLSRNGLVDTTSIVKKITIIMNIDWGKLLEFSEEVSDKFHKAMKDGADSLAAKDAVTSFREFVNILMPCDDATFRKIAQAYLEEKKEISKNIPGLAGFVNAAILYFINNQNTD
ncbi:MerR family transcriptional regulator [Clostridium saccharoperbutylacetonicum]|uniref:MerR family transcriptional regulator n=1 Tax=Clostridium saccharoperbutylacetonicum TaxID=36745 RepID=UPI0039EAFB9B